jgi:hypothetical protein
MANLFGAIGLQDSDRLFNGTVGQQVIYQESDRLLKLYDEDLMAAGAVWVGGRTDKYKERFRLPGGGQMQRRGRSSRPAATKANGSWDVSYPLIDFGDALTADDVSMGYMTAAEYSLYLQNIMIRDANTYRFEMLKAIFNSSGYTFSDEIWGDLSVVPLANQDGTLYPPVLGATAEAESQHFIGSNYVTGSISDTNNPIATIVSTLEQHFGTPTAGSNVAVFINNAETAKVSALTAFVPIQYFNVTPGDNTATVAAIDPRLQKGSWRVIGVCNGATICEWRFIPSGYMAGVHLGAPPPLVERIDPADTNLGVGLQLVARDDEFPFETAFWRHRFGLGIRNRLNGVALQLVASTTYTTPTVYA